MALRHPDLGNQIVEWKTIFDDLPLQFAQITQYSLEHPECFYLPDNQPNFQKYFPKIYKTGFSFSQLLTIIFSKAIHEYLSNDEIEEYKLNASKLFFRTLCLQNCKCNLDNLTKKTISKVFANVYLNCAFGYKHEGKIFGFKKFEKNGQTFCNFSEKTPILVETLTEMTAHTNIFLKQDGVLCLMKPNDLEGKIYPTSWNISKYNYLK